VKEYFHLIRFRLFLLNLLANSVLVITACGQPGAPLTNAIELHQAFLDLANDGVLMNLSAHPDDEDGATLAYYRMKFGVHTYSVLFTRGEGGQNETGPELYEELGVLRTEETLQAGKLLGAEVHFLNFQDFGYSKTASETFTKWGGQQEVLRRLVFAIRKYKPDILFTNHGTVEGHGHHQAVAITAIAAFDAAADATMFPEQLKLKGLALWQPRKLFFRNFGRTNHVADVVNAVGDTNALRGKSYLDIAADALAMHKTQGMDRADLRRFTRGLSLYRLMRSNSIYERDTTTFFGGITFWSDARVRPLQAIKNELASMRVDMQRDVLLERAARILQRIRTERMQAHNAFVVRALDQWERELQRIVQLTCNLTANLVFRDNVLVPQQRVSVHLQLASPSCSLSDVNVTFTLPNGWSVEERLPRSKPSSLAKEFEFRVGEHPILTLPRTKAQYTPIEDSEEIRAQVEFTLNGRNVSLMLQPAVEVAPALTLEVHPSAARVPSSGGGEAKKFFFTIKNFQPHKTAGRVSIEAPKGWMSEPVSFVVSAEDSSTTGTILVKPPAELKAGEYRLRVRAAGAAEDVVVKVVDWSVERNIRLGIIKSYDNTLEAAAAELGLQHTLLTASDLDNDLSAFNTIVVDIRAYLTRPDLRRSNQKLLEYVKRGGNLVVMYQKDQDWKPEYAPYPFTVTRKRISVEEAPVEILHRDHPLLNAPNVITNADWEGWMQERGVYFPDNVPPPYTQLLSSNDPDEPALTTGYLVANYGSGSYIYTSYVWYRQLKEYNAGAWRNFINMICYPNHRKKATP
jgi:LmbE family N-acetylglucosaminyl deacetylase